MAPSTATGLSNLQDRLSLVFSKPQARAIPTISKALRAQAANCIRFSAENNDLLEFLGDRLVNLITALVVEEVKIDKCHHSVRPLGYTGDSAGVDSQPRQFAPSFAIMTHSAGFLTTFGSIGTLLFHPRTEIK